MPGASTESEMVQVPAITEPVLSLDKIVLLMQTGTVMGFSDSADADYFRKRKKAINEFIYKLKMQFLYHFEPKQPSDETRLYLYHFRLKGGFDIQMCPRFGIRHRIDDEGYVNCFGTDAEKEMFERTGYIDEFYDSDYGIRLEFNPAKNDISLIADFLTFLCEVYREYNPGIVFDELFRVTRLDVAVDYPQHLNPCLFTVLRKQKNQYNGGRDGVETIYFGAPRTFYHWRIYDKKRELFEQQNTLYQGSDLWRIELECKKPFAIGEDCHHLCEQFRQLEYYYGLSTGDWKTDFIMHYAKCFGMQNALKSMPKATQNHYREILSKLDMDTIKHPAYVVGWQLPKAWRSFYDTFQKSCGRQSDKPLYVRNVRETM